MKTLVMTIALILSIGTFAEIDPRENGQFETCTEGDLNLLGAARYGSPEAIRKLVDEEILESKVSCVVSKPRFFHPAVCGAAITQIDTFIVNTDNGASYTVVVDSSYRSCLRIRVVPVIKSLKYEPTPKVIPFP